MTTLTWAVTAADDAGKGQIRKANEAVILGAAERVFASAGLNGATMAAIAHEANLPKANLHYYFGSKSDLYRAVLARTLTDWLVPAKVIHADAEPRVAIEQYIRAKMALSQQRPDASKVFANELLHGAPVLHALLATDLRQLAQDKAAVIDGWVRAGRMAQVDPFHLLFAIWAVTQTYADFDAQIKAVLGRTKLGAKDHAYATDQVVAFLLRGCGLL